jgi:hypothetical protein
VLDYCLLIFTGFEACQQSGGFVTIVFNESLPAQTVCFRVFPTVAGFCLFASGNNISLDSIVDSDG